MRLTAAFLALSALALAACDEDTDNKNETEQTQEVVQQEETAGSLLIEEWNDALLVEFENLEIILPENRIYQMTGVGFCPSLSGQVDSIDEYQQACTIILHEKMQYYVDRFACDGHGERFYSAMPVNTIEAARPFSPDMESYNTNRFFTVEGMQRNYERYGKDVFTVSSADHAGEGDGTHSHGENCTAEFTEFGPY